MTTTNSKFQVQKPKSFLFQTPHMRFNNQYTHRHSMTTFKRPDQDHNKMATRWQQDGNKIAPRLQQDASRCTKMASIYFCPTKYVINESCNPEQKIKGGGDGAPCL